MNHLPADGFFMSPDPVIPPFEQAYIEVARINAMMLPVVYFLLEKFDAVTDPADEAERCPVRFREMKAYLDEFFRISMQKQIYVFRSSTT